MRGPVQVRNGVKTYKRGFTDERGNVVVEELPFLVKDGNNVKPDELGRPRDLALELLNSWNKQNTCFTYWLD